jgi:drug/metabolite transporter (DMT)-like permease
MLPAIRRPNFYDVSTLFFLGAIWGSSFIFVSFALPDFGPASIAGWRVFLAAIVLFGLTLASGRWFPRGAKNWYYIVIVGCLNSAVPFFLISWGQQFINSAEAALLMAMGTFCSLILSHFTSVDERINIPRLTGVTVGFVGVLVLVFWDIAETGVGELAGQIAVIGAGCSYAISSVIARRLSHLPSIPTAAATMASASLYMIPIAFLLEEPLNTNAELGSLLSLVYLGVVATALGVTLRFVVIRANGAVFMAQVGYLVPLFGVIWSAFFFADVINVQTLISLGLILLGIAISRYGHASVSNQR